MKIISVDIFQLQWFGLMPAWHPVVIRINTDAGISGFGEAGLAYGSGGLGAVGSLKDLAHRVIGQDPLRNEAIWNELYQDTFWGKGGGVVFYSAVSAIDTALWDIKGKYFHTPVYQLLGGQTRNRIRAYASQIQFGWGKHVEFLATPKDYAQAAEKAVQEGYTALKVDPFMMQADGTFGVHDQQLLTQAQIQMYYDRIAAVRQAVGENVDIILECHARLNVDSAIKFAAKVEPLSIYYMEEPNSPMNPQLTKEIRNNVSIPLASGERLVTRYGFKPFLDERSLSVIQPDVGICGGITEAKKISDLAAIDDVSIQFHVCGSPIATAAALQLEAVSPNALIHEYHEISLKQPNIDSGKYHVEPKNGWFTIPDRPGIGQELSTQAMKEAITETIQ